MGLPVLALPDVGRILLIFQVRLAPDACRRKNLGYLWAIQHGAEELYETDDDNEPVNNALPNLDNGYYVYNGTGRKVANPYAHFGFPNIWPRGYPLDQIRPEAQAERFSRLQVRPLILQGLADKDPDVDAIFRCMRLPLQPTGSVSPAGTRATHPILSDALLAIS